MPDQPAALGGRQPLPRSHSGCRVHERQLCDVRTSCQPTSTWGKKGVRWAAVIRDASATGLSLVIARRFEPGAGLAVELPGGEGRNAYVVLAKVLRAKAQKDGSWVLAC